MLTSNKKPKSNFIDTRIMRSHLFFVIVILSNRLDVVMTTAHGPSASMEGSETVPMMAGYQPKYFVPEFDAIDLDVQEIDDFIDQDRVIESMLVYEYGGNTRPYAILTIDNPLPEDIEVDSEGFTTILVNETTEASGGSFFGSSKTSTTTVEQRIYGTVMHKAKKGSNQVHLLYKDPKICRVGAKMIPILDGCFPSIGNITVTTHDNMQVSYSYDPKINNANDRAVATFSTKASSKMKSCNNCEYFFTFAKFVRYFDGITDYADRYIKGAANGEKIVLGSAGVFDFKAINEEGRAAAIKTALVSMNIIMFSIRELEHANDNCHNCQSESCHTALVKNVDASYALFAGSMEGPDGTGNGKLLYAMADKECTFFKTCGQNGDQTTGVAHVNLRLAQHYQTMQHNISVKECSSARSEKDTISKLLTLPLIQGTLRYAYLRATNNSDVKDADLAVGTTLAASVAPLVAACSYQDAVTITTNMQLSSIVRTNFDDVRDAFVRHYECLGITCHDVGGLWDSSNEKYYDNFEPCHFDDPPPEEDNNKAQAGAIVVGVLSAILVAGIAFWYISSRRRQSKQGRKGTATKSPYHDDDSSDSSDISNFRIS